MSDLAASLVGVTLTLLAGGIGAVVHELLSLRERVARLEGRMNGTTYQRLPPRA